MQIVRDVVETKSDKFTVALIDMEGVDLGVPDFNKEHLQFNVKTYAKFDINAPSSNWVRILKPINQFLQTLTPEESKELGLVFYQIHKILHEDFGYISDITRITNKISELILEVFEKNDLSVRIYEYVKNSNIPIPDLEGIGTRPQDRKSMTFQYEDYLGLTSIVLICKLFCPVFGEIIFLTRKWIDNSVKEAHCIAILRGVLGSKFAMLSTKLQDYIHNLVIKHKDNKLTSTFNGFTHDRFSLFIYSAMLVKKFVNVDLYNADGNIMVYVLSCSRGTLNSMYINMSTKNTMMERRTPEMMNDAEGNASTLETESISSRTTADVPILVEVGARQLITRMIDEYDLDQAVFDRAVAFYQSNPVPMTEINKYILCTFYGHRLGGAAGIDLLKASTYVKMIALIQLYMLAIGYTELVHLMSVTPTDTVKSRRTYEDNQILMNKGASFSYKNCKEKFPYMIGNIGWDSKATSIINEVVTKIHLFNTAPSIWEAMGAESTNGHEFTYSETIIRDVFKFLHHIFESVGQAQREVDAA